MKTIIVKLDDQTVEITKLPIGKYPQVIAAGKEIFGSFAKFDKLDNETLVAELPGIIESNIPAFIKILSLATPVKEEELENFGLYEFVELTLGVVEVNRYLDIYNRIKKGIARPGNLPEAK